MGGGCSAVEVDHGDLESERLSGPKNFFAGTPNLNNYDIVGRCEPA